MNKKNSKTQKDIFHGEKALVVILGIHGGGVATAKWLLRRGAQVSVTDERSPSVLKNSLKLFTSSEKKHINFILGGQHKKDFQTHDLIVVGPGVPRESEFLKTAKRVGKKFENDASLFFRYLTNPIIGVTGTRGKTTTTLWVATLLKKKYTKVLPSGNNPENSFLKEFERINNKDIPAVVELSSWRLEYLPLSKRAPHISVITNLFPDHLNRYGGNITEYADAKSKIFFDQHEDDFLILNHDNEWSRYFLNKKPRSTVFFISKKQLPKNMNGLFVRKGMMIFRFDEMEQQLMDIERFCDLRGEHNLENLLAAVLAVKLYDPGVKVTERDILSLPTPRMRQEVIVDTKKLMVVNDSCATSPDGTIAAIKRFSRSKRKDLSLILITGGTDKELEFEALAKTIAKNMASQRLILLEGSATTKLVRKLHTMKSRPPVLATLDECVAKAFEIARESKRKTTVLFSPGAASFEKFLHEFDRGERFNALVKKAMKKIVQ